MESARITSTAGVEGEEEKRTHKTPHGTPLTLVRRHWQNRMMSGRAPPTAAQVDVAKEAMPPPFPPPPSTPPTMIPDPAEKVCLAAPHPHSVMHVGVDLQPVMRAAARLSKPRQRATLTSATMDARPARHTVMSRKLSGREYAEAPALSVSLSAALPPPPTVPSAQYQQQRCVHHSLSPYGTSPVGTLPVKD